MKYIINTNESVVEKCVDDYLAEKGVNVDASVKYDIMVYALNKLPPQYVVSARGRLHSMKKIDNAQNVADIYHAINEGFAVVMKRRNTSVREAVPVTNEDGYYIIYPEIMGTVFNGKSFMRLNRGSVCVCEGEKLLEAYSSNFPNPYTISEKTSGRYMFRFMPKKTAGDALCMTVLSLRVESIGFEPYICYIKLPLQPVHLTKGEMPEFPAHNVNDIYLTE
ncbi:MAG: late competence development ComFB family protein [Spirochaetes bacterium]|nr:late competence development ComFB family protein [Spirochaetota bacterium]